MDVTVLEQGSLVLLEAFCREEDLESVEKEIHKILKQSITRPINEMEIKRAHQLVKNGLCFSLETSSQVANLAGSQTLWRRYQPLLAPLKLMNSWTDYRLQKEVFTLIQPELSCTLIATSGGED